MDEAVGPEAGWYPQGEGLLRYWDGFAWTDEWTRTPAPPPPPQTWNLPDTFPVPPVPAAPVPVAAATAPAKKTAPEKKRTLLALPIALAVVGAVALGVALFLSGHQEPTPQSGGSKELAGAEQQEISQVFDLIPEQAVQVDLSFLGDEPALQPIFRPDGSQALSATTGDTTMLALAHGDATSLIAINPDSGTDYPWWVWRMPSEGSPCQVGPATITCDGQAYDITQQGPVPARFASGVEVADSQTDQEPSPNPTQENPPALPQSTLLTGHASDEVPYSVTGTVLENKDGRQVTDGLSGGDYWALPAPDNQWVISNGKEIFAAQGKKILWRKDLEPGSTQVNGFDQEEPHWQIAGNVVLLGEPDGIFALDANSGDTLWKVSTPVDSWEADTEGLVVETGQTLAILPFPAPAEQGSATSEESATPAANQGEPQVLDVPALAPPKPFPSEQQIRNATLDLPEGIFAIGNRGTFVDGSFAAEEWVYNHAESVWIEESPVRAVLDGEPYAIVTFGSLVNNRERRAFGVYDADLSLVDQFRWTDPNVSSSHTWMCRDGEVEVVANGPTLTLEDHGLVAVESEGHPAPYCGEDFYYAIVTMAWNGSAYETVDVLYRTPHGDSRDPDMGILQEIYDQIAAGNDAAVSQYVAEGAFASGLDSEMLDWGPTTHRDVYFAPGGGVTECTQVSSSQLEFVLDDGWRVPIPDSHPETGDFECSVRSPWPGMGSGSELIKWHVRTDAEGVPWVIGVYGYTP